MKNLLKITLAAVLALTFTACGSTPSKETKTPDTSTDSASTPAGESKEGATNYKKEIVIGRPEDSNNLDPVTQDGNVNIWLYRSVLEGLVKSSDDGTATEPCLAEKWDVSEDGLTYTFHLLKDIKFSDGTPVKGSDWVWTLERARDTKDTSWAFSLEAIEEVTAPDDQTVVIKLTQPWAPILADLAMFNAGVQSEAYFNSVGLEDYKIKGPIGTGAYKFSEWLAGEELVLTKNENYRNASEVKTDSIKFVVIPDDNSRILQLQSGDIDIATFVPFNRLDELKQDTTMNVLTLPSTDTRYIQFTTTFKPLDNLKVRQALYHATNIDAIIDTVFYGYAERAVSFMSKSGKFYDPNLKPLPYDVDKAKALLKEAGLENGFDITLTISAGDVMKTSVATILKEQWSKIGVNLNISSVDKAIESADQQAMKTQITIRGWTNDMVDPSQQVDYFCIYDNIKNMYTGWKNDEIETYVKAAKVELDDKKREELYFKAQEIYNNDLPTIPMLSIPYTVVTSASVKDFNQSPLGGYNFETIYAESK